jgi:hypothetical protein
MKLSKYERETIITYNEESDRADIYTCSRTVMHKLDKLCDEYPETYQCISSDDYSVSYRCPVNRIRFAKPPSEKQKQACLNNGFKSHAHARFENI